MTELLILRPTSEADLPFLLELLATTLPHPLPADNMARTLLLRLQLDTQLSYYRRQFPRLEGSIVMADGVPAGRLYLERTAGLIHVIDISLLPEFRRQRIGGRLLAQLQEESERTGRPLRLHVLQGSLAMQLCQRLGFAPGQMAGT